MKIKFRHRQSEIEAEQFVLGRRLPEGVHFHERCPDPAAACHLDGKFYVKAPAGHAIVVKDGDWIVPSLDGKHYDVMPPAVMEQNYERTVVPGPPNPPKPAFDKPQA